MARLVNESGVMGDSFEATAENVKDIPFDQLIEAIHQTQVEMDVTGTTAKEASETVSGSFDSMKAAGANLVAGLGDANADIGALMENLGSTVEIFVGNVKGVLSTIWDNLPLTDFQKWVGVLLTSAGPLLFTFGKVIKVISAIPGALALLSGPVGVAIGILAGLVAVGLLIYDNWELIKSSTAFTSLVEVFEMVKNKFIEMKDAFLESEAFETIKQTFTDLGQAILDIDFVQLSADIQAFIDKWAPLILGITGGIVAFKLITGTISTFKTTMDLARLGISAFSGGLALLTSPIGLAAIAIAALIAIGVLLWQNWDTIGAKLSELKEKFIADWEELKDIVGGAMTTLKDAALEDFEELKTGVTDSVQTLKTAAIADFNELKTIGSNAMETLKSAAVTDATELKTGAGNMIKTLKTSAINDFNQLKTMGSNAIKTLKSSAVSDANQLKSGAVGAFNTLRSSAISDFNQLKDGGIRAWNSLKSSTSEIFNNVKSTIISAFNGINLFSAGKAIIDGFLNGLKSAYEGVKSFVGGIATWIKDNKGPISYDKKLLIGAGNAIMDGLNKGLQTSFKDVQQTVSGMAGSIYDTMNTSPVMDINGSIARSNAQVNSSVSHELKQNTTAKQPANLTFNLGNKSYRAFVDDISNTQNAQIQLTESYL